MVIANVTWLKATKLDLQSTVYCAVWIYMVLRMWVPWASVVMFLVELKCSRRVWSIWRLICKWLGQGFGERIDWNVTQSCLQLKVEGCPRQCNQELSAEWWWIVKNYSKIMSRRVVTLMVYRYDVRLECEKPWFNSPLRHRIFLSIWTHIDIWSPTMGFINLLFVWSEARVHFYSKEVWVLQQTFVLMV